eukprot:PhM_4_TR6298/c0_g1_i1/m.50203
MDPSGAIVSPPQLNINPDDHHGAVVDPEATVTLPLLGIKVNQRKLTFAQLALAAMLMTGAGVMCGAVLVSVKSEYFGGDGEAVEAQVSVDSTAAFFSLLLLPIIGSLSDDIGRRPFLRYLGVILVVPYLLLVLFSDHVIVFMVALGTVHFTTGLNAGSPMVASCLADMYSSEERAKALAMMMAATCTGLGAAPILIGLGVSNPTVFATALGMVCCSCAVLASVRETLPAQCRRVFSLRDVFHTDSSVRLIAKDRNVRVVAFITFCATLPEVGLIEMLLFYLKDRVGFVDLDNGLLLMEYGILVMASTSLLFYFLHKYTSERAIVIIGLVTNVMHLICYAVAMNKTFVFLVCVPLASTTFITFPAATAIVSRGRTEAEQGALMGVITAVKGMTMVVGPLLMGVLYSRCKGPPVNFPQLPMIVGACIVFAALVCAVFYLEDGTEDNSGGTNLNSVVINQSPSENYSMPEIVMSEDMAEHSPADYRHAPDLPNGGEEKQR